MLFTTVTLRPFFTSIPYEPTNILQRLNGVFRADRNDLRPVDLFVRKVVVLLARLKVGGILEGGVVPVEVLQPSVKSGIVVTNCR